MTAPDRTPWTVEEDYDGDPTLWYGDIAILRQFELESHGLRRAELPIDLLWQALTRVLVPDEATIERLARAVTDQASGVPGWDDATELDRNLIAGDIRALLAALADTSAQARHTDGDATGGGEHG